MDARWTLVMWANQSWVGRKQETTCKVLGEIIMIKKVRKIVREGEREKPMCFSCRKTADVLPSDSLYLLCIP